MSQDGQDVDADAGSTERVSQPSSGTDDGFESVTIRSYLAEQFGVREVEPPVQSAAPAAPPTDAKAELAKWRERVPKLASALKQRAEQIGLLETELARLQSEAATANVNVAGPGLKARDEHIAALELKLSGLTANYQTSEGTLRARELELEDLRTDLAAAKQRWQTLTEALDAQVASTDEVQAQLSAATEREASQQAELKTQQQQIAEQSAALVEAQQAQAEQQTLAEQRLADVQEAAQREEQQRKQEFEQQFEQQQAEREEQLKQEHEAQLKEQADLLQEAQERLATLDDRNAKLLETTELANNQLVALSQDLSGLQAQLANQEQAFAAKLAEREQVSQLETAQIQAEHSERLRDIHAQTLLVFEALEQQGAEEQSNALASMQASLELSMHSEYVELQQAAQGLKQQISRLQTQLLYQQQTSEQVSAQQAQARQREVNQHRQTLADVTLALEADVWVLQQQLQEQQTLLDNWMDEAQPRVTFLGEISDANEGVNEFEQAWSALDGRAVDETNETIRELERLLKIRNEELSAALAARVHFLPNPSPLSPEGAVDEPLPDAALDVDSAESDPALTEEETVVSLRAENDRLRQQLERTSAALLESDDLTQLKGVGGKMAEQLRELGFSQFAQIAAMELAELEDPKHPLYNLRGRIERNGWIQQAKAMVHPLTLYGER